MCFAVAVLSEETLAAPGSALLLVWRNKPVRSNRATRPTLGPSVPVHTLGEWSVHRVDRS